MELFNNITTLQDFVNVDSTLSLRSLKPFEEEVKQQILFDWIGEAQYNDLKDNINNLSINQAALLSYVRRVVANFCVARYLEMPSMIGNSGAYRVEGENQKSVYKYQNQQTIQTLTEIGWNAVESMLKFLNENQENYPLWASEAKLNSKNLMINSYKEFKKAYHVVNGRWIFEGLRAIIKDIELFILIPVIGQRFYNSLKLEILYDNVSEANANALEYIQKAVAYLTIEQAIAQKKGVLQNNSFVFIESTGNDSTHQLTIANSFDKKNNAKTLGNSYINYLKAFLLEHIDIYPDFAIFHNEKLAAAEEAAAASTFVEARNRKIVAL